MSSIVVAPLEPTTEVVIEETSTVVTIPPDEVTVVGLVEQGIPGAAAPDIRYYDFFKKGLISAPYTSPMRRYVEKSGQISNIVVGCETQPVGQPLIIDILRNGVSVYTSDLDRPTIPVLSNVGTGALGAAFAVGDYMKIAIVAGTVSDLTVSITLNHV